jgi:hypothetical protein
MRGQGFAPLNKSGSFPTEGKDLVARLVPSWVVLSWIAENVCDFIFSDAMTVNVWLARCRIKIAANVHAVDLS